MKQGVAHLDWEFAAMKEFMVEALNEMRNTHREEERGKVVMKTQLSPSSETIK